MLTSHDKNISQLREQIINDITDALTEKGGSVKLKHAAQDFHGFNAVEVSNNDDGTIRLHGLVPHEYHHPDPPHTMMQDEIPVELLNDILKEVTGTP